MTREMRSTNRIPPEGDPKRYVYVEAAQCSHCGAAEILIYGKNPREIDGTVRRYAQCRKCRGKFIVIEKTGPGPIVDMDGAYPVIHLQRVACPQCASTDVRPYKSRRRRGGMTKRYSQCQSCAVRFVVITSTSTRLREPDLI